MRTRVKFCGITSARDARAAVECGADAIGVIFAPASPRYVSAETAGEIARAVPPFIALVGVFVDPAPETVREAAGAGYVPQYSGDEPAGLCEAAAPGPYVKAFHADAGGAVDAARFTAVADGYARATWLFDTAADGKHGGTGRTFDWSSAREIARARPIVIGGGLTPGNVGDCVRRVRPFAVDVRSGIETSGVKDDDKMRAFVRAVKEADEQA